MKKEVVLVFFFSLLFLVAPVSSLSYELVPSQGSVSQGERVSFDVIVSDVVDLYAFGFDVVYGPDLKLTSSHAGDFLSSDGALLFTTPTEDNGQSLRGFAVTRYATREGVSGSGVLASFNFNALSSGSPEISLSNIRFFDKDVNEISFESSPGTIVSNPVVSAGSSPQQDNALPEEDSEVFRFLPVILISLGILIFVSILVVLVVILMKAKSHSSRMSNMQNKVAPAQNTIKKDSETKSNRSAVKKDENSFDWNVSPVIASEQKKIVRELKKKGFSDEEIKRRLS